MFLKLALEPLEERNGVGGRTCETHDDLVVEKPACLARAVLHHVVAHGHLPIGDQDHFVVLAHAQHRSAVHLCASLPCLHPIIIQPCEVPPKDPSICCCEE